MSYNIEPAKELYLYMANNPADICGHSGFVGYRRGRFESEQVVVHDFPSYFIDRNDKELDAYMDELFCILFNRENNEGIFRDFSKMKSYCENHPEAKIENAENECGFKAENEKYLFLIRCICAEGCDNVYVYAYNKALFEMHFRNAAKGIRFIDSGYKTLFTIPDGGKITVEDSFGNERVFECRYIDSHHTMIGFGIWHICQFAEFLENQKSKCYPYKEES